MVWTARAVVNALAATSAAGSCGPFPDHAECWPDRWPLSGRVDRGMRGRHERWEVHGVR